MLHAVIGNKSSRWKREARAAFLNEQNRSGPSSASVRLERIPREDEITSTVFGSLRYFDAKQVHHFLFRLMDKQPKEGFEPASHSLNFWPSKRHAWNNKINQRTEPDLVIDFKNESGSVVERIIVELKWGSGLGVDQLAREWHAFNEGETHLIYLSKIIDSEFDRQKSLVDNPSWVALTWHDLLFFLKRYNSYAMLRLYESDLIQFLNVLGIDVFDGFYHLNNFNEFECSWKFFPEWNFSIPDFYLDWKVL
mgnify:CR=1 FL=1